MLELKDIADSMSEKDLIFTYQGIVNDAIVNDMIQLAESAVQAENVKTSVKRKIFRVLLEGVQNSYKHQSEFVVNDETMQEITIVLARKEGFYELFLGNYIEKLEVVDLKNKIDHINSQNETELRESYRETLNNNNRTKAGGSGLGLMDIARKTGEHLNYKFSEVDEDFSYFTLNVKINKHE